MTFPALRPALPCARAFASWAPPALRAALLALLVGAPAAAQGSPVWWTSYNGPPGDQNDSANLAGFDAFGNAYSIGFSLGNTGSLHTSDLIVLKHDPAGNLLWEARWDGGAQDQSHDAVVGADGSVYVCGEADDWAGSLDYVVMKVDPGGAIAWSYRWDGPTALADRAYGIALDPAGNVLVTGESGASYSGATQATTLKLDPVGNLVWERHYVGPAGGDDCGKDVLTDSAGNVYVAGGSTGTGNFLDFLLLKYSPAGQLLWERRYDGPTGRTDVAFRLAQVPGGDLVLAGHSEGGYPSYTDLAAQRYDADGNLLWTTRWDNPHSGVDHFTELAIDASGAVYLAGLASSPNWDYDISLGKLDAAGQVVWSTTWDHGGSDDFASGLAWAPNGRLYLAGASFAASGWTSDAVAAAWDTGTGALVWEDVWNGPGNDDDGYYGVAVGPAGALLFVGDTYQSGPRYDLLTSRYDDQAGFSLSVGPLIRGGFADLQISGAQPFELVHLGYSLAGSGPGPCYPGLGGLCLDILEPVTALASLTADGAGGVHTLLPVPSQAPLVAVHFQAAIARGSASVKSNVASQLIQ